MGGISVKLHREFSTRASRSASGPAGRTLREMRSLFVASEPPSFRARAAAGVQRILLALLLWMGCFLAGAVAFAFLYSR